MNGFGWRRVRIAMLAAVIALQSLWMTAGIGGESALAAPLTRVWQTLGGGAVENARSISIDLTLLNDTPYIIYNDGYSGRQIRAKKWESGSWQYAGSNGNSIDLGHSMRLTSSQNGTLYAAYLSEGSYKPSVMALYENNWSKLGGMELTSNSSQYPDVAVGADYKVYATYADGVEEYRTKLRIHDGTAWSEPEDLTGPRGSYPSLTMGSDGNPLLFYSNGSDNYYLPIVKHRDPMGSWSTVGGYPFTYESGFFMEIEAASDGKIYMAFNSGNSDANGMTHVWHFDGSAWNSLGSWPANKNQGPSLAIDPTDQKPVIAYLDIPVDGNYPTSGRVHVKKWNGSAWEELGQAGDLASLITQPALAIGSDGTPYLAYSDSQNDERPTVLAFLPETTPPVLVTQTPALGAIDAPTDSGLSLTFDEDVMAVAGKIIEICYDGSNCEQVDAGSSRVTAAGRTATIAPSDEWEVNTVYTVNIEAGSFADLNGNPSATVANWTFTTSATRTDTLKPRIINASVNKTDLILEFSEALVKPETRNIESGDIDVRVNGTSAQKDMVAEVVNSNQVIVVLTQPVARTDIVTVAYVGGDDITDAAGNTVNKDPIAVTNLTPGAFQTPPQLQMQMKADYVLKPGDAIVRFVPSVSGAVHLEFEVPSETSNPPTLHAGSIAKTDFVIKDIGNGMEIAPRAVSVTSDAGMGIYQINMALPIGVSLTQGNTYELAMSASSGRNEISLPANPTANATAYLGLVNPADPSYTVDEYQFENVTIGEKDPVDLMVLQTAITSSQAKHDAAVEGGANGDYEAGSKAVLQAAIVAAASVRDNAQSLQEDVDAAVTALGAAVTAFEVKRVYVDLTSLGAAIIGAQAEHDVAIEGGANGNYEAGSKAALQAAIDAATTVRDNAASTQAQVDAAVSAVNAAVAAFDAKRVGVDLTSLETAIAAAQTKHDAAVEGGANGNYEVGSKAALQAAIDAATSVRDNAASTQAQVNVALTLLNDAVTAFDAKRVGVDLTSLEAAITAAQAKHDAAVEGEVNGNYEAGSKVELQAVINAANAVRDNAAATQAQVDEAVSALNNAVTTFDAKRVDVIWTALESAIATAQAKHDVAVEGSANGNYATGSKDTLQAFIDAAIAVRDNAASTQVQVNVALTALNDAVAAFDTKRVGVDLSALETEIAAAQAIHDAAVEGSANGNYKVGSKAVLQAAIDAAIAVRDNAASTQAHVNAAVTTLNAEVTVFDTKKIQIIVAPSGGGGGGQPTSTYTLEVSFGGLEVGSLSVKRTTDSDGRVKDTLELSETFTEQAVDKLKKADMDRLVIALPESRTAAQVFALSLPSQAATRLASGGITLVVRTPEAGMTVPSSSFQGANETLTFTISPVLNSADQSRIEQRAEDSTVIQTKAGAGEVTLIGKPVEIETNLQQRKVILTLAFPGNSTSNDVGIYIEHSDGTTELVRGRVIEPNNDSNTRLLEFDVTKFSTFAIVNVAGWSEHGDSQAMQLLGAPYMSGYSGGLFKPNASLTRAEMAAILARIIDGETENKAVFFSDVPDTYWASEAIQEVVALGIMRGYPEGTFQPKQLITRAEMATILSRLPIKVDPNSVDAEDFSDTAGHSAQAAIRQARAAGLLSGFKDGTFRPEKALSRVEAVIILNKLIGLRTGEKTEPLFVDVPKKHWAFEAIQAATKK